MITETAFTYSDNARLPQQVVIDWERELVRDETHGAPDEDDEGFWPSTDPDAPGYVEPEHFEEQQRAAKARMRAWQNGDWEYVGVIAKATIHIPLGGASFRVLTLRSAGLWGVESDAGEYLDEVFEDEKDNLLGELRVLGAALANTV